MVMKSIANQPGSGFNTHLLTIEEVWWVREHPFNARCVAVKRKVKAIEEAEQQLEKLRAELEECVDVMNEQRLDTNGN